MKVTILGEEITVQSRLMPLGFKDALRLSQLNSREKVYLPDDRPRIDGEIFEDVIREPVFYPPPSTQDQYTDAIRGHDPSAIEYEPFERRRYILI